MFKKRNLLFLFLLILILLLFTSCFLKPPTSEGLLKGQVLVPEGTLKTKDLTGEALPDATINILDLATLEILATTVTDANGYYEVFVPDGGPYLLIALKEGLKLEQITCVVEVGMEYDLGTVDCVTTAAALIAQALLDEGENLAEIDCAAIIADENFNDVSSVVCSIIEDGGDPTVSATIEEAIEDFLNPSAPIPTPAPLPTTINIAAIPGITAPVTYATPVTTITETDQYTGIVNWTPIDDPFFGGTIYTATITLSVKTGFTLTGIPANFFTVDGATTVTNTSDSGVVTAVFPETAVEVINIEAIPGVNAPVTYASPVTTITETEQYTGTVAWAPIDDPFERSKVYVATITLTAKTGFTLTGIPANFFTVDGATTVTNTADSGVVIAVFPETEPVIDIAAIPGITVPKIGATPVTTITETDQYTGTVSWAPADNPFQEYKVYVATITLTAKTGFTLTGVPANFFTVEGASTVTNIDDSGVVIAVFPETVYKVGDSYAGGIVAYVFKKEDSGYVEGEQHGLIADTADVTSKAWSNITDALAGATGEAIGTGQANTTDIVNQVVYIYEPIFDMITCTSGAAYYCANLIKGDYDDWFLPSRDELYQLYLNKDKIGGFVSEDYWSSSESDALWAYGLDFSNGYGYARGKSNADRVRAVRYF
jgi:hypothetical protein